MVLDSRQTQIDPARKRRNVILALVHVALAAGILAAFVFMQTR